MSFKTTLTIFGRAMIRPVLVAGIWFAAGCVLVSAIHDLRDTYDAKESLTMKIRNGIPTHPADPPTHWHDMLARVKGFERIGYLYLAVAVGGIAVGLIILYRRI